MKLRGRVYTLACIVAAIVFGTVYLAIQLHVVRSDWQKEQLVARKVAKLGGRVEFRVPTGWIYELLPERYADLCERIDHIDLAQLSTEGSANDGKSRQGLRRVRTVLDDVGHLDQLRSIDLRGTDADDSDVVAIARPPTLRVAYVYGSNLSEHGVARLKVLRPDIKVVGDRNSRIVITDAID
jgi:hypothetical protein